MDLLWFSYQDQNLVREFYSLACYGFFFYHRQARVFLVYSMGGIYSMSDIYSMGGIYSMGEIYSMSGIYSMDGMYSILQVESIL